MLGNDLPLFAWTPPSKVLVFPLQRRVGRVRHVASKLLDKQGELANTYWRQIVTSLTSQMERAGISEAEIDRELKSFFDAVQSEMARLTYRGQQPGGGAA